MLKMAVVSKLTNFITLFRRYLLCFLVSSPVGFPSNFVFPLFSVLSSSAYFLLFLYFAKTFTYLI